MHVESSRPARETGTCARDLCLEALCRVPLSRTASRKTLAPMLLEMCSTWLNPQTNCADLLHRAAVEAREIDGWRSRRVFGPNS